MLACLQHTMMRSSAPMTMRSFALTTIVLKLFLGRLIELLPRPRSYR